MVLRIKKKVTLSLIRILLFLIIILAGQNVIKRKKRLKYHKVLSGYWRQHDFEIKISHFLNFFILVFFIFSI